MSEGTANVSAFPGCETPRPHGEPNEALVDMLRDTLAMAESGQLQSFIGTGFTGDRQRFALWCYDATDVYQWLGSLAWLEHEYVHRMTAAYPPAYMTDVPPEPA